MLRNIVIGIVLIVILVCGYAAVQPTEYLISREISINASADRIFPWINNSKKLNDWMPWRELDPQVVITYAGPEEGVGAISRWESEGQMGVGSATITESVTNSSVKTSLEYQKPFPMVQQATMAISVDGSVSTVKWSVSGRNNFVGRLFCIFVNMDKMVGGNFEKGLVKLKATIESEAP